MKYQNIVHTEFVADIITDLECMAYNCGWVKNGDADFRITQEMLFDHFQWAAELVQEYLKMTLEDLAEVDDPADYNELKVEIASCDKMMTKLGIIQDLEEADYATPNHIFLSIETLSAKLSEQLEAKANEEANYNEYYCNQLAECLKELCELIIDKE